MTNPNPENPAEETPVEPQDAPEAQAPAEPQPLDSRRRLRELLSVPERDRSDEQWDEIIELEIQLAPGNRLSANEFPGQAPRHGGQGKQPGGGGQKKPQQQHRPRTKTNRRPRQNKPGGGGSGGGAPA